MTKKMQKIIDFLKSLGDQAFIQHHRDNRRSVFSIVDHKRKMCYTKLWHQTFYALLRKGLIVEAPEETKLIFGIGYKLNL